MASGVLFKHVRLTTYVATAGLLAEAGWLLATLMQRTLFNSFSAPVVLSAVSILWLFFWLSFYKQWFFVKGSRNEILGRDVSVLIVLILAISSAYTISSFNGFQDADWVMHGFYNGDTTTFVSLVQRSLLEEGLVKENVFASNGFLEYPSLLHAGMANFVDGLSLNGEWLKYLPWFVYVQLLFTVPIFFLLWDLLLPPLKQTWKKWLGIQVNAVVILLPAVVIGYVMFIGWDNFVYPQSHFFLVGHFVLLAALLHKAVIVGGKNQLRWILSAYMIALLLLLSNAVTGAAAVAVVVGHGLFKVFYKKGTRKARLFFGASIIAWAVLFLGLSSGEAEFSAIGFSYTAVQGFMNYVPILSLIFAGVILQLKKYEFISISTALLISMAVFTFLVSGRDIIVANSSRFLYHGILISFPLIAEPLVRLYYYLKKEFVYSSRSLLEVIAGILVIGLGLVIVMLPAASSVASAHDNLIFKDEQVISEGEIEALQWISANTSADDIFLQNPDYARSIPFFTGRTLYRVPDFWLSVQDNDSLNVSGAFMGSLKQQEVVMKNVDYLLLRKSEVLNWKLDSVIKVFENDKAVIYK